MKNHRWVTSIGFLGLLMLVALTLVGCEVATPPVQPPTAPPASTATSTATASPRPPTAKANTPTPTALRPTQAPTLAPTLTPAATHTQVPPTPITWENTPPARAVVAIAPENANRVVPLAQWGKGNIQDAAYSPDGKTLGIASSLGVYLYDSLTLEPIIFYPTPFSVTAIQFSPDGLTAAWGFANGTIEIRQAATGEILQTLAADQNRVLRIAYAADGHRLTAIQDDLDEYESGGMAYVWDLEKGEVLSSHEINFQEGFDLSLDGQVLAIQVAYSQPPQIALADVASWELIRGFHFEDYLYALTISPDGKQLAAVSYDLITLFNADQPEQTIRISDLPEYMSRFYAYECQIEADGPGWGPLRSAAYSPDGKMIVLGSRMDVVQIRRTSDGALLASFPGRASRIVFAPDGQTFTLLPGDGAIEIRRVGDGGLLQRISGLTNFRSVAFSPDQRFLAAGASDDFVRFWSVDSGQRAMNLQTQANRIAYSPDGGSLATGSEHGGLVLWNLSTGKPNVLVQDALEQYTILSVNSLRFTPDGQTMLVGSQACRLEARDARSGELKWSVLNGIDEDVIFSYTPVETIAIFPDNKVTVNNRRSLIFFDPVTGKPFEPLLVEDFDPVNISYLADGDEVVIGSRGRFKVLNVGSAKVKYSVSGPAFNLIPSPDGQIIVTTDQQGTIYLWLAENGQPLAVLPGHRGEVSELTFSMDGKYLASSSEDGTIRLWGVQ